MGKKDKILKILAKYDVMEIIFDDVKNYDEYSPEAEEIYKLLPSCKSVQDLEEAIQAIFKRGFGNKILEEHVKLSEISKEIWDIFNNT